ncbi:Gp19/Gp15/Gp42 family protein [Nocardioides aurantiacus]|uniref:Gp19/Gp15/Gp42-like protein n=1 Tax=Nocardioides aurantiacus TaxID=86796 RepID=A0A3N2CWC9_9ACTN|nr:Gp19/Gp15/Gp42 family protein [Nocardioides aurantiacus]ROR91766.1 Gp19/Gp15/Gp42-like protein [Nocardioides aurantiacus]
MGNPATVEDLEILWRPLADDERDRVQARLDRTWRALVAELPGLEARIASGEVAAETVADVVIDASLRVLNNPEGLTTFDESIDDYKHAGTYGERSQSNDLYFTAAELRRLSPRSVGGSAFTITPGR